VKRPAFQFYPADWRKDAALQSCSIAARGLWHELLCVMHESTPYGHLTLNGEKMPVDKAARVTGTTPKRFQTLIAELRLADVFSETKTGIIYSRRMVRDERIRNDRATGGKQGAEHGPKGAEFGHLGGRPKTPLQPPLEEQQEPPLEPPPSSSASSSFRTLPTLPLP